MKYRYGTIKLLSQIIALPEHDNLRAMMELFWVMALVELGIDDKFFGSLRSTYSKEHSVAESLGRKITL